MRFLISAASPDYVSRATDREDMPQKESEIYRPPRISLERAKQRTSPVPRKLREENNVPPTSVMAGKREEKRESYKGH